MKTDGWKYLKGIFLLDEGEFQVFPIVANGPAISIIHHILREKNRADILRAKGLELLQDAIKLLIDILELQLGINLDHGNQLLRINGITHNFFKALPEFGKVLHLHGQTRRIFMSSEVHL